MRMVWPDQAAGVRCGVLPSPPPQLGSALSTCGRARARAQAMSGNTKPFVLYIERPTRQAGSSNQSIKEIM